MERLTEHHVDGKGSYMKCSEFCDMDKDGDSETCLDCEKLDEIVDRLAAYEDTGLDPEEIELMKEAQEISESMAPARLIELSRAEKAGRLVVLPCKVGDLVLVDMRTFPYNYLHPADGCDDYAKCEIVSIVTTKKEKYMKLRALYPSRARKREYLRYGVSAIGKTVFLTREKAEEALRKEAENG